MLLSRVPCQWGQLRSARYKADPLTHRPTGTWSLLIMSYFAFNCCDCVSPSDPLKAADRTKRWECWFTMHCEFYWLQIKIKHQLSISLGSVTFSNNNWSMQYESAGVSENHQRPACILLGKWIDECVNTKLSPVVVRRYEKATFLMT